MKRFLKYLYYCALTFCSLFAVYYITTPKAEDSAFFFYYKTFLGAAFIAPLPFFLNKDLRWKSVICEACIGLSWIISAPFIHRIAFSSANLVEDIAAGCYAFSLLILIKWYLHRYLHRILAYCLVLLLQIITLLPPLLNIIYFTVYKSPIGINAMMAIMQTNPLEVKEYLISLPLYSYLFFSLAIIIFLLLFRKQSQPKESVYSYDGFPLPKMTIIIALIPLMAFLAFFKVFKNTKVLDSGYQAYKYFTAVASYREKRIELLKNLQITNKNNYKSPHTIILVIGESASRDYMHAFTTMEDNTTPWLSQNKYNFILFPNAYSCAYSTIMSLQHALTAANYYNQKSFTECLSIIDIAKAVGYKTYWFSNQGKIGKFDTPITLIAEQSDHSYWLNSDMKYDGKLVELMDKVNPEENNFIVFHLMGSHTFYSSRYPNEFQIWSSLKYSGGEEDYKNSILYTDKVLKDIFECAKKDFNLASFIYFSDHGTDPTALRNPDSGDYKNLRIPLFVYFKDGYKKSNTEVYSILEKHKDLPFSNDLLFNMVCSIFNIESDYFKEDESIASPKYKFDITNIKTDYGKKLIKDDPNNPKQ